MPGYMETVIVNTVLVTPKDRFREDSHLKKLVHTFEERKWCAKTCDREENKTKQNKYLRAFPFNDQKHIKHLTKLLKCYYYPIKYNFLIPCVRLEKVYVS